MALDDILARNKKRMAQLELDNKELRSALMRSATDELRMLEEHAELIQENERLKIALKSCGIRRVTSTGLIVLTLEATKNMHFPFPPETDL